MIIMVNVSRSIKERDTLEEAASGYWKPHGEAQIAALRDADIVVAVVRNVVKQVFLVIESFETDYDGRWEWDLEVAPAYASLKETELPEIAPRWIQGDGAAWKVLPQDIFDSMVEDSKTDFLCFGPHEIKLDEKGNVEFHLAAGYSIDVVSLAPKPGARERIQRIVTALAETPAVATYQAIADALGINSAQSVARSIVRNKNINAEQGAHVIPFSFRDGDDWVVPGEELGWVTLGDDKRNRAQILTDIGSATMLDNGDAVIDKHLVITEATTLRHYLNV